MSKQLINERAYMQKVAGLITESEYVAIVTEGGFDPEDDDDVDTPEYEDDHDAYAKKPDEDLSPEEQDIVDDIIGTVNEGMFSSALDKIKTYAKKGLMTAGIVAALLASPNFSQAEQNQIKHATQIEASATQNKGDGEWEQVKKSLSSTSPKLIRVDGEKAKAYGEKPFESLNWGAHKSAGHSAGISITHEKGSNVFQIDVTYVQGKDKKGYDQIIKSIQNMGINDKYNVKSDTGFAGEIPVSKVNDVIKLVNGSLSLLK